MPAFLEDLSLFYGTGEKNSKGQTLEEFLEEYDPYRYKNPCATTDTVVFSYTEEKKLSEKRLKVLLVKRGNHPSIGYWALPGGFVNLKENLEQTARRELEEETGVKDLPVEQFACFGAWNRDPRARVITTAYLSLVKEEKVKVRAGDDAADAAWFQVVLEKGGQNESENWKETELLLKLKNEEKSVTTCAQILKKERKGLVKEMYYEVKNGGVIAVDHAAILAQALEILYGRL